MAANLCNLWLSHLICLDLVFWWQIQWFHVYILQVLHYNVIAFARIIIFCKIFIVAVVIMMWANLLSENNDIYLLYYLSLMNGEPIMLFHCAAHEMHIVRKTLCNWGLMQSYAFDKNLSGCIYSTSTIYLKSFKNVLTLQHLKTRLFQSLLNWTIFLRSSIGKFLCSRHVGESIVVC